MVEYQYTNPMWPFFILFIVYDIATPAYHRQPILYIKKKVKRGLFKVTGGKLCLPTHKDQDRGLEKNLITYTTSFPCRAPRFISFQELLYFTK